MATAGEPLRDLDEILGEGVAEGDWSTISYVFIRCSGLYSAWALRLDQSGREGVEDQAEQSSMVASSLLMAGHLAAKRGGIDHGLQVHISQSVALAKIYDEAMTQNYLLSASVFSPQIEADMKLCAALQRGDETLLGRFGQ